MLMGRRALGQMGGMGCSGVFGPTRVCPIALGACRAGEVGSWVWRLVWHHQGPASYGVSPCLAPPLMN